MANPYLVGNGYWCDACSLQREAIDEGDALRPLTRCQICNGTGRLAHSDERIVAGAVMAKRQARAEQNLTRNPKAHT